MRLDITLLGPEAAGSVLALPGDSLLITQAVGPIISATAEGVNLDITLLSTDAASTVLASPGESLLITQVLGPVASSVAPCDVTISVAVPGSLYGPTGPQGPVGPQGEQGPVGTLFTFVFTQAVPSSLWTINHGLNYYPSVTVLDSTGGMVEGDILYASANQILLTFAGAFSGQAFLN